MPTYGAFRFAFILPIALTSCSFIRNEAEDFVSFYENNTPLTLTEYNYATNEKPKIKVKGFEDYDFKISTDEFYVKKTIRFSSAMMEQGNAFIANEERRESEKYLTLH